MPPIQISPPTAALVVALALTLAGCHEVALVPRGGAPDMDGSAPPSVPDAGRPEPDAGLADAGLPPSPDAGLGVDAGADAGPACECNDGACCDGCHLRPPTYQCSTRSAGPATSGTCTQFATSVCGGQGHARITRYSWDRWCSGSSPSCDGPTSGQPLGETLPCDPDGVTPWAARCVEASPGLAACEPC